MLKNLRDRAAEEEGFTLIELLVVILIIGILAAIALPTFLGQKDKAKDSSAKSDVRNSISHMESCLVDGTATACSTDTQVLSNGVTVVAAASDNSYTLNKVSSSGATNNFTITKTSTGFIRCKTGAVCTGASTW